jgi:hypothetical protein
MSMPGIPGRVHCVLILIDQPQKLDCPSLEITQTGVVLIVSTVEIQNLRRRLSGGWIVIMSPAKPPLPQATGAFLTPFSSLFDFAENSNF